MHVIVERTRFFKMLRLTTDRRDKRKWLYDTSFLRIEAKGDRIGIKGRTVEADFPAAVYRPGVLFIRARRFYEIMQLVPADEELVLDMRADGMHFSDVTYGWETGDALLYLDPAKAPAQHPEAPTIDPMPEKKGVDPMQGKLFAKPD